MPSIYSSLRLNSLHIACPSTNRPRRPPQTKFAREMIEIRAFTEPIADTAVRFQITLMDKSVMLWVQQADVNGGDNRNRLGSMSKLAAAMPGMSGCDGLPAATALLGSRDQASSEIFASRIAKRCGVAVFACIDLGDALDVAMDSVFGRIVKELESLGVVRVSSASSLHQLPTQ